MVSLRRGPRLQRQCKVKQESAEQSPAPDKENLNENVRNTRKGRSAVKRETAVAKEVKREEVTKVGKQKEVKKDATKKPTNKRKHVEETTPKSGEALPLQRKRSARSRVDFKSPTQKVAELQRTKVVLAVGAAPGGAAPLLTLSTSNTEEGEEAGAVIRVRNVTSVRAKKKSVPLLPPKPPIPTPKTKSLKTAPKTPKATPTKPAKSPKSPKNAGKSPKSPKSEAQPAEGAVFRVRGSCPRKKRHSEVASLVESEEAEYSVCSVLFNKRAKKRKSSVETSPSPLSPVKIPSSREQEKLEQLERSMNLFQCPLSPIGQQKDLSKLALKSHLQPAAKSKQSLAKSKQTLVKSKQSLAKSKQTLAKTTPKSFTKRSKGKTKSSEESSLKTPLRKVFQKSAAPDTSMFDEDTESDEEGEGGGYHGNTSGYHGNTSGYHGEGGDEAGGFSMYPLSREVDVVLPEQKCKPCAKSKVEKPNMDYTKWLETHNNTYEQFKDLELCVE